VHDPTGEITPRQIVKEGERSSVLFLAQDVPGHGYKTFFFRPGKARETRETASPSSIENEFYLVEATPTDGTLVVTDKETGAVFPGVNRFVDGGDRGDEYNYCAPEEDTQVSNPSEAPTIAVVEAGPVRQTLQVRLSYRVPLSLAEGRRRRLEETVEIPITSRTSLYPGVKRIDIHTTVTNRARDHRLRVHFPTPWRVESSCAESAFDVIERPIDMPMDTNGWIEQPVPTHPQATFVDLSDGHSGLMVANKGLPEYEAFREGNGTTIALTLLRCVGWLSRDDLNCRRGHAGPELETPEAQCLGTHSFDYALIPHTGDWRTSFDEAHAFNAPLRAIVTDLHRGTLPLEGSFVEISPSSLVISAIKSAEDGNGLILRFWNTENFDVSTEVKLLKPFERVAVVNLNEEELEELRSDGTRNVSVPVRGKEIVTLKLQFRG
jgi:alpha-mannosidase